MKKYLIVIALAIAKLTFTKEEVSNNDVVVVTDNGNMNGAQRGFFYGVIKHITLHYFIFLFQLF